MGGDEHFVAHGSAFRDCFLQFFFDLSLGFTQDILDDGLAGDRVSSCGVPPLPATILSLSQASFAVSPSFCHSINLLPLWQHTQYRNTCEIASH